MIKCIFSGSEYRVTLNNAILRLGQLGRLDLFKKRWWVDNYNEGRCSEIQTAESKQESLQLSHIGGIFILLLAGLALSLIVAVIENTISSLASSNF